MKKFCLILLSFVLFVGACSFAFASDEEPEFVVPLEGKLTVGFLYEGDKQFLVHEGDLIKEELTKLAEGRYAINFVDKLDNNFSEEKIKSSLGELMADSEVDAIVGMGYLTGMVVVQERDLAKPVILSDVYDISTFCMPYSKGVSDVKSFTYLSRKNLFADEVKEFRELVKFSKLHILADPDSAVAIRDILNAVEELRDIFVLIEYKESAEATISEVMKEANVEAVLLANSDIFYGKYRETLIKDFILKKIPTFSNLGTDVVEQGVLAGMIPKFYAKFARRVALNLDRIFRGEKAEDLPVDFYVENRFVINARTARQIGVSIPFSIVFDAKILHPYEEWGPQLTIRRAVENALKNNFLFKIKDEEIKATSENHHLFWSEYLPQLQYALEFNVFDSERARNGSGLFPKRSLTNRFSLRQVIFSDPLITDIANSRLQIFIERLDRKSQELDITDETSRSYLDFLIAKAIHKVNISNMEATKHNLSIAEKRYKIGAGGREEVYRWESVLSDKKSRVLRAESDIYTARVALNQLMNFPLEAPFVEEDVSMEMTRYYLGGKEIKDFVENPNKLKVFIDFNVDKGVEDSPELAALDLGVNQQNALKNTAAKRFILPEAELSGNMNPSSWQKNYSPPAVDDHADWYMGIDMTYPIFEGGGRVFNLEKQKAELERVKFVKELAAQLTDKEIRDAAYSLYYSLPNIKLTNDAMVSSGKNYKIVESKYAEGTVSITDLIDAQNDKFASESAAVIAVYEFLQDLSSFDRAVSHFLFFANEDVRKIWMDQLREYFANRGIDIQ